jgi:hypothetical protein
LKTGGKKGLIDYDDLKVGEGRACLARFRDEFRNCMMTSLSRNCMMTSLLRNCLIMSPWKELDLRARDKRRVSAARMAE